MRRKIGYILLGVSVWIGLITAIHFTEKAGVDISSPVALIRGGSVVLLVLALALYFVPGIIASRRGVKNTAGVILLNVLLGWTGLGWIAALIWSVSGETSMEASSRQPHYRSLATPLYTAPPPPPRA